MEPWYLSYHVSLTLGSSLTSQCLEQFQPGPRPSENIWGDLGGGCMLKEGTLDESVNEQKATQSTVTELFREEAHLLDPGPQKDKLGASAEC